MLLLKRYKLVLSAVLALGMNLMISPVCAQEASPFTQLAGNWRGYGTVRLTDGRSDRLACRGNYAVKAGGSQLSLSIRCESANNKIDMRSSLDYERGRVSGHWQERNFGLEGEVAGSAAASRLNLQFSGQLQGSMAVTISGASHRVSVTTAGPGFRDVSISFSRG
ncbi:MAG TPA: hypothetical protein VE986_10105 [Hyphomicrobiales bacterium]|nr:hypothetical protein [Hyphomicrobiales bacterium]